MKTRRTLTILFSIGLIVFIVLSFLSEDDDFMIFAALAMLPLGLLQLSTAAINFMRGSKIQGVYLFVSLVMLAVTALAAYGLMPPLDMFSEQTLLKIAVGVPMGMATIFTIILFFDPVRKPKNNAGAPQDLLDDDDWMN